MQKKNAYLQFPLFTERQITIQAHSQAISVDYIPLCWQGWQHSDNFTLAKSLHAACLLFCVFITEIVDIMFLWHWIIGTQNVLISFLFIFMISSHVHLWWKCAKINFMYIFPFSAAPCVPEKRELSTMVEDATFNRKKKRKKESKQLHVEAEIPSGSGKLVVMYVSYVFYSLFVLHFVNPRSVGRGGGQNLPLQILTNSVYAR